MTATPNSYSFGSYEAVSLALTPTGLEVGDYRTENQCGVFEAKSKLQREAVRNLLYSPIELSPQELRWLLCFMLEKGVI